MLRPHPLAHLHQQLLLKRLLAQTPTAPNRLELLAFLRPAPFIYISLRACLDTWDPAFLRENIHVPPGATGAAYVEAVLGDLHRLLK